MSETKEVKRLAPPIETITLLDIESLLGRMLKHFEEETPEGIIEALTSRTVTTTPTVTETPYPDKLWFGVKITNDGPSSVWLILNTEKSAQPLEIKDGETWGVQFTKAVIRDLYMYTELGTSTVRIRGER